MYEIPLIKRLKAAHATNLHVSTTEHIIDTSGKYKDKNDKAYQYSGHWSWIYFHNNESKCDDCGIDVFSWIKDTIK